MRVPFPSGFGMSTRRTGRGRSGFSAFLSAPVSRHERIGPVRLLMFGASPPCAAATTASADFCPSLAAPCSVASRSADEQTSRSKTHDLPSIHPPHLRPAGPGDFGLRVLWPPRPPAGRLRCGSCSSGRSFACGFLPITPRGVAVAVQLGVPVTRALRGLSPPGHASCPAIGIGGSLAAPPLPHHRAYGSVHGGSEG